MNNQEYSKWILTDTLKGLGLAITTYAVVLVAYWVLVG